MKVKLILLLLAIFVFSGCQELEKNALIEDQELFESIRRSNICDVTGVRRVYRNID